MSLTCQYAQPVILHFDHDIVDNSGPGRVRIDPGQMAHVVVSVKNFGPEATCTQVELTTSDPYLCIHEGSAAYGNLEAGAVVGNTENPFVIEAFPYAPQGHLAPITLTAVYDGGTCVSVFPLRIGRAHFMVWDPTPDESSGPTMYSTLRQLGYSGIYCTALDPERLADCQTLWTSLGIRGNAFRIAANSSAAMAITDFLTTGGNVYLEGGDAWYHDPTAGGHDFGPLFDIYSPMDGSGDLYQIVGDQGTFAEGILMSYQGQENSIDRLLRISTGTLLCHNNAPWYWCAVACDHGDHRTIGASFEFAGLRDAQEPSTKTCLADAVMHFFLNVDPQQIQPSAPQAREIVLLAAEPNPCTRETTIGLRCPARGTPQEFGLFDASGRRLQTWSVNPTRLTTYRWRISTGQLAAGCYFIGDCDAGPAAALKLVVVR